MIKPIRFNNKFNSFGPVIKPVYAYTQLYEVLILSSKIHITSKKKKDRLPLKKNCTDIFLRDASYKLIRVNTLLFLRLELLWNKRQSQAKQSSSLISPLFGIRIITRTE